MPRGYEEGARTAVERKASNWAALRTTEETEEGFTVEGMVGATGFTGVPETGGLCLVGGPISASNNYLKLREGLGGPIITNEVQYLVFK
jgi:hypothetical protein